MKKSLNIFYLKDMETAQSYLLKSVILFDNNFVFMDSINKN